MENYEREQNGSSDSGSYSNSSNGYGGYDPDFQRIRGYINSRNFVVAEEELNRIGTRNAEWYFLMGSVLIEKGNFYKGYTYIKAAVNMDPDNEEYQSTLDDLNFKKIREYISDREDFSRAEEELNKIGTRNAEWYFLMGAVLINKGNYSEGYVYIQKAVNMDPDNEEYQKALDDLNLNKISEYIFADRADRKDFSRAEEELNKIGTRNAEWYFLMGYVLIKKGNFSKGYEYIQEAVNMDPDDEEYQSALDYFKNSYRAKNGKYYDKSGESNDNTSCEQSCEVCICLVFGIYACWNYFHS